VIVILGGAANNRGVLLGTFVYLLIFNAFNQGTSYLINSGINIFGPIDPTRFETIFIGVMLILILLRRPQGLISEKPTLTLARARLREMAEAIVRKGKEKKPAS